MIETQTFRKTETITRITWCPVDAAIQNRVEEVIASWEYTPHRDGHCLKKQGADCRGFAVGVLDDFYGTCFAPLLPRLPPDSGHHSALPGLRVISWLRHRFPTKLVRDNTIEPGDILVCRGSSNPLSPAYLGHVMVAGAQRLSAAHAIRYQSVRRTTIEVSQGIVRIYRMLNKEQWVKT